MAKKQLWIKNRKRQPMKSSPFVFFIIRRRRHELPKESLKTGQGPPSIGKSMGGHELTHFCLLLQLGKNMAG